MRNNLRWLTVALIIAIHAPGASAADSLVIKYRVNGQVVSKDDFAKLKSTITVDNGSMLEGTGINTNTQIYQAKDTNGAKFKYTVTSIVDALNNESQTRDISTVNN